MTFWKRPVFHPILLSVYPLLSIAVANYGLVIWSEAAKLSVEILAAAAVLLALISLMLRSIRRAALVVSLSCIMFFSFGHLLRWYAAQVAARNEFLRPDVLTLAWVLVWIAGIIWLTRTRRALEGLTSVVNITAAVMVGGLLLQFGWLQLTRPRVAETTVDAFLAVPEEVAASSIVDEAPPDIYYIVLDSYTRADVLREVFSFDNEAFLRRLEDRGFYVAEASQSNYGQTALSLSSSLNFQYLNEMENEAGRNQSDYLLVQNLLANNRAMRFLKEQGYEVMTIESGYDLSEFSGSGQFIPVTGGISNLEASMMETSFSVLFTQDMLDNHKRTRWVGSFQEIQEVVRKPSPKFVFMHHLGMHAPFWFNEHGETLPPGTSKIDGYRAQIEYLNQQVEQMVDAILAQSTREPIIILQGDHGSEVYMDFQTGVKTCFHERMSILNAIYLPGDHEKALYPSISPVNTFRVVFDSYLGTELGLLLDESYYSIYTSPLNFKNVTYHEPTCAGSAGDTDSGSQ